MRRGARQNCIFSAAKRSLRRLAWGALLAGSAAAHANALELTAITADGHPLVGAIVTVFALAGANQPAAPVDAVVDQINLAFEPDLTVIPTGSSISFPNSDSTSHQVYSFSPAHRFQLPLYRGKPYPPEKFDQPGLVTLGCNIHDAMLAYVVVTDAQYFGRTDAQGIFTVPDAARGRYRVELWHPRMKESVSKEITVGDAARTAAVLRLERPLKPAPLSGHPHSWDAY